MEHRGVRYTIRTGIERGLWSVAIYPGGVESSPKLTYGTRKYAESRARSMIDRCLQEQSGPPHAPKSDVTARDAERK
jgi:hypothetical protein